MMPMPVPPQSKTAKVKVKLMDLQADINRRRRLRSFGMDYGHDLKATPNMDLRKSGKGMRLPKGEIIDGSGPWRRKKGKS
jgi:hypothetical protein